MGIRMLIGAMASTTSTLEMTTRADRPSNAQQEADRDTSAVGSPSASLDSNPAGGVSRTGLAIDQHGDPALPVRQRSTGNKFTNAGDEEA
jgi:hypothetical protein